MKELSYCAEPAKKKMLEMSTVRTLNKRGVVWLGQTCNSRCFFCYWKEAIEDTAHPEHAFMPLDKAKRVMDVLREVYGNDAVDIQGGEPTIYPHIFELIKHCVAIGLRPTLITNGLVLENEDLCRKYKEAGLIDFLFSIHGLGDTYDEVTGVPGGHVRQMKALRNLQKVGVPFRFNVTLTAPVVRQLPELAIVARETGARVVNFISYNPYASQSGASLSRRKRLSLTEIRAYLTVALDTLEEAGIEANVRYYPLCMLEERHRKSGYNVGQFPYDPHEWDLNSWFGWTELPNQRLSGSELDIPANVKTWQLPSSECRLNPAAMKKYFGDRMTPGWWIKYALGWTKKSFNMRAPFQCVPACADCDARKICDGFHADYCLLYGENEATSLHLPEGVVEDMTYYIRNQAKVAE